MTFSSDTLLTEKSVITFLKLSQIGERNDGRNDISNGFCSVSVAAKVYGKDACWVRAGIISGWLPIGKATRNGKEITSLDEMDSRRGRINFYISPKKLWEHTGFVWRGERV